MNNASFRSRLALALVAGLAASAASVHAQSATATISDVPSGPNYDYTITLFNNGSTDLNSFWYGWTSSGNNLPSDPTTALNSLGWGDNLDNNSIKWVNSTGTALAPGNSATFTFVSSSSPTAITTPPAGESVAYVNGIDFSEGRSGDSTGAITPTLVVPEPSSADLLLAGLAIMSVGLAFLRPASRAPKDEKASKFRSVTNVSGENN